MSVIAFTSAKGAPGVSTAVLSLGSVWTELLPDRRVLIIEADPAGGEAAVGLLRGTVDATRGLLALAAMRGVDPVTALWTQLVALDDAERALLLLGLSDPSRGAALDGAWTALGQAITIMRGDAPTSTCSSTLVGWVRPTIRARCGVCPTCWCSSLDRRLPMWSPLGPQPAG